MQAILVLFGGQSSEHEVSIRSARNIIGNIDQKLYQVVPVYISKQGDWLLQDIENFLSNKEPNDQKLVRADFQNKTIKTTEKELGFDAIFPIIHGQTGEDGSIQGLCKFYTIPCVSASLESMHITWDKELTKKVAMSVGVRVANWKTITPDMSVNFEDLTQELGATLFVKPARSGSSVGVTRVTNEAEFKNALNVGFEEDSKLLVEEAIVGREIETAVRGRTYAPDVASVVGEITPPESDFYSYDEKYSDASVTNLSVPADVEEQARKELMEAARKIYAACECSVMARIDFFVTESGGIIFNEVNAIPGFTSISMYPKIWEASGVDQETLVNDMIASVLV